MTKKCYNCQTVKTIENFTRRSGSNSNYRNICKVCTSYRSRQYRTTDTYREKSALQMRRWRANPENKHKEAIRRNAQHRLTPIHAFRLAIFNAKKRAAVSLTIEDLLALWRNQNGRCVLTGITMTWGTGRIEPTSMSVDRIDPQIGYSKENVRLICHSVNMFRGNMTDKEMLTMAKTMIAYQDRTNDFLYQYTKGTVALPTGQAPAHLGFL